MGDSSIVISLQTILFCLGATTRVSGLFCRTPQKELKHALTHQLDSGESLGENGMKFYNPGANLLDIGLSTMLIISQR